MLLASTWPMLLLLVGFFVLMMVMTIIPQRKQKKKQQAMMSSITVGDKIMTIGGFIGVIISMDTETERYVLNVGTEESPVNVAIIKNAVRSKLDK